MKARILILALTAIAASSQASFIGITQTLPEFRSWNLTEFSPFTANIPVYGTFSLDERDGIAKPFLPGNYLSDEYLTASFIAPETEPNGGRDGFVGAGVRTGRIGTIRISVHRPEIFRYEEFALVVHPGIAGRAWDDVDGASHLWVRHVPWQPGPPPVPEPASLAVLGVGALAILRRRKR